MGSLFKWVFGLILLLLLLVVAAVVVLPMVVDPNDYKPQIEQAAKEKLGRDLTIEQDLSLSVFPWLGIETGGVRVGNAPGFKAPVFAEVERLGVKVKLMPLLSRRVEVDTLVLTGLRLNLERDAKGKTNWDDLVSQAGEKPGAEPKAEQPAEKAALALSVQGVQIEDAEVSWDDRQAGQQYTLEGVRLVTGALSPGATVPVEGGITFSSAKPAMTLKAILNADVSSNRELTLFKVAGLVLELDAEGEGLPKGGARLTLKTNLVADTKADSLTLEQLEIGGPALAAKGEVSVSALQTSPTAKGRLSIDETNLKTLASMFATPMETVDPTAMTRASGELAFAYAEGVLKLDPLTVHLDDSNLTGHLHLLNTSGPVVRTTLELDQIDLDRYMPPAATAQADTAPKADGGGASAPTAAADPFAALRTLDFIGEFKIGRLKVGNARMSNVTTKVVSRKGVLKIDPVAAKLYEGNFAGNVMLDANGKKPRMSTKSALTGIQIGPLLKDVAGEDRLVGRGELHADISVVGLTEAEVRRTLNGTSRFSFTDGALKGINLAQLIREASSRLGLGGDKLDTGTPGQTDFTELGGSFTMTNGVIKNNDLAAKSPLLRIEGRGQVDLPKDSIDYLVTTTLVRSLEGQGGKGRDELAGIPIPVRVTGPLAKPSYRPDLEAALSAKAKQEVQKKVEEKLQDKVGDALKGLFK